MTFSSWLHSGLVIFLLLLSAVSPSLAQSPAPDKPPVAESKPVVDDYFGNKITDPYRWMEAGPSDPKVLQFLKSQNDYARSVLAPLATPRNKLLAA